MQKLLLPAVALWAATTALAAIEDGRSLPNYDVRGADSGQPRPDVLAAMQNARPQLQAQARERDLANLIATIPHLRLDEHEFLATPLFLRSTAVFLTPGVQGPVDARQITIDYLAAHRPLFEIDPGEVLAARVDRDFKTQHNGVTHLSYQQQFRGVDIYGCEVSANVSRKGELINISCTMLPRPRGDFVMPAVAIAPDAALRLAAESIGVSLTQPFVPAAPANGMNLRQSWNATPDFRDDETITTELIYFPYSRTDIRPAWSLVLPERGIGNTYEIFVDAVDGRILRRWNRLHFSTEPVTYNVYTSDSPAPGSPGTATPTGFQFPVVSRVLVTKNPADVDPYSPAGWIADGQNETLGNNVDGHTDTNANNQPDLPRPAGSPYRVFDFPLDLGQAPSTYAAASVTQLFYLGNLYHDRLYAMGFNEQARNFQTNNFGNGGTGNDAVQADGQDGSGTNNANFGTTGTDGSSARCQMYIFTGTTPDRDGSLDADIVYHEFTHGLSIRLHRGLLTGSQGGGMGEGWSDFFGIALSAEPSDDPLAVYPMGGYATLSLWGGYTTNYYFGIRRYPYSYDMTKNPETFRYIDPSQFPVPGSYPPGIPRNSNLTASGSEVHNSGEVWCQTLMDARTHLIQAHGFAGNQLMMQLAVDGMKLTSSSPNFLIARDGILQADMVNNGGANLGHLWRAFARRGMGFSATSPGANSNNGVVEAYDIPSLISFTYPDGRPTTVTPNQLTTFRVSIIALGSNTPTPGTGRIHTSYNGAAYVTTDMEALGENEYRATLPALQCGDRLNYYVSTEASDSPASDPANAPTTSFEVRPTPFFSDDLETDLGWTVGAPTDTATTGIWVRVNPNGTAAQPEDDHTPAPGVTCYVTGQGTVGGQLGAQDVDGGTTTLSTPTLDLSGLADARISYWRWFSNTAGAEPRQDVFVIDISNNNGASWVNVEVVGPDSSEVSGGWFFHDFAVSSLLPLTSQMKLRFVASDAAPGSIVEAAVDDFLVEPLLCPVACIRGDMNGDSLVDGGDIGRFVEVVIAGGASPVETCAGDLAANGSVDQADVAPFTQCILAGGCP